MTFLRDERAALRAVDIVLVLLFSGLLVLDVIPRVLDRLGVFAPRPFSNVQLQEIRWQDDGNLFLHATYDRGKDCAGGYIAGIPFALMPGGQREALAYEPIRADSQTEQRLLGPQNLRWVIDPNGFAIIDTLEIVTRHQCAESEEPFDLHFLTVEVPER